MNDAAVRASLAALLHTEILSAAPEHIVGGSINRCFRYRTREGSVFVKVANVDRRGMFDAEAAGLKELLAAQALRVPNVLGVADTGEQCVLALEWLELHRSTPATDAALGEQFAQQHRVVKPLFGFKQSNFIGTTPQPNLWSRDWLHF
jgi:protein-ribulosamine 3-kinase